MANSEVEEVRGGLRFAARLMAGVGVVVISASMIGGFVEWRRISDELVAGPIQWTEQGKAIELRLASIEHLLKDLADEHERIHRTDENLQLRMERAEDEIFLGKRKPPLPNGRR